MMKTNKAKLLLLSLTTFLISCAGTQDLAPDGSEISIGVNTIIIHSDLDQETAFRDIGNFLIQKGYSLENTSPEFYSLNTNYKRTSRGSGLMQAPVDISVSASVVDQNQSSQIILSAILKNSMLEDEGVQQKGQTGSVMRVAWDEFYNLAKSYSDSLTFETR